ncbi:MAG: hypothetical protein HS126_28325 [Anaerolineales bacterium]|nr:hypothetical protein [Anaerolineales bacterium]
MNLLENSFDALRDIPLSKLPNMLDGTLFLQFLPQNTVLLTQQAIRDAFSTEEPRLLTLIAHLYLDYVLGLLLNNEKHNLNKSQQESFHAKLQFLNSIGKFQNDVYASLTEVNRLRNLFAHNIFFEITDWNPAVIPYVHKHNLVVPKRKNLLRAFSVLIIRFTFLTLLEELERDNRWLYFEYIYRTYQSRVGIIRPWKWQNI